MSSVSGLGIMDIETCLGITEPVIDSSYSLPKWYERIRSLKIGDLTDGDLARMLRQDLYVEYILLEVLERLESNPLTGEMYEGELITAFSKVKTAYWVQSDEVKGGLLSIVDALVVNGRLTSDYELISSDEESQIIECLIELRSKIEGIK